MDRETFETEFLEKITAHFYFSEIFAIYEIITKNRRSPTGNLVQKMRISSRIIEETVQSCHSI